MRVWVWSGYENGYPDPYPAIPYPQPTGVFEPMEFPKYNVRIASRYSIYMVVNSHTMYLIRDLIINET